MDEYRIITLNDNTIKCFRDGRIHTLDNRCKKYEKWIERSSNPDKKGYIRIQIGGKNYRAHRLIMEVFEGPSEQEVDHIDRNKSNNNFQNLRYCSRTENNLNKDCCENAKGYYRDKNKWKAQISIDSKQKHLGYFDNEHEAHQAFLEAKALRKMD